ncbi:hypothetical protein EV424DRAFT_1546678 [Suillus variegatus]|nr:hypothetical protein EV424DRAFT_1546678 [Suillus variegatus]
MSSSTSILSFSSSQSQFLQDLSADFPSPKAMVASQKGGYMRSKSAHGRPPVPPKTLEDLSSDFSSPKAGAYMRSKSAYRHPAPVPSHSSGSRYLQERLDAYKAQCRKLQCEVARLSGERDTIKQSFDDLIKVLRLPTDTDPLNFSIASITARDADESPGRPNRISHPKVRFWLRSDYDRWLDNPMAQRTNGNRGTAPYLEDENGSPISSATLKSIRRGCRGVWAELVVKKLAPPTWARLCATGQKLVRTFMEKEFPIFRLDMDGWKLSLLCTTDYPNWRKTHIDNDSNWKNADKKVVKCEVIGGDDNMDGNMNDSEAKPLISMSKGKKRARDAEDTKATHKRLKDSGNLDIAASSSSSTGLIESPSHSSATGNLDAAASSSSSTGLIESLSHSSATGNLDAAASSSSSTGLVESLSHSSATGNLDAAASSSSLTGLVESLSHSSATGSLNGTLSAPSQTCKTALLDETTSESSAPSQIYKTALLDETFLPPLPPLPPSPSPLHGIYLPQPIPQVNNLPAEKENVPIVLKNPLADVFGGANGIPKRIPSPALCEPDTTAKNVLEKKSRTSNVDGADATPSARMRPGPAKNGRNLCAIRWQKNINKKGTTDQFRLYWGALSTAQQDEYQAEAEHLNSAGSWKKPSDSAVVNGTLH